MTQMSEREACHLYSDGSLRKRKPVEGIKLVQTDHTFPKSVERKPVYCAHLSDKQINGVFVCAVCGTPWIPTMPRTIIGYTEAGEDGGRTMSSDSLYTSWKTGEIPNMEVQRLQEENKRLREALNKYGNHKISCLLNQGFNHVCDCGLSEALGGK